MKKWRLIAFFTKFDQMFRRLAYIRSFFLAFFEPTSSILIQNLILYSNHSIKLLVLIGFLWNLQKCNLNLPGISCSGSPLLCLCVKNFCFVIIFKLFVSLNMVWTETDFFIGNFFCCFDLWRSTLYRFCKWSIDLIDFIKKQIPTVWWFQKTFKGQFEKNQFVKKILFINMALELHKYW